MSIRGNRLGGKMKQSTFLSEDQASKLLAAWCSGQAKQPDAPVSRTLPDWKRGIKEAFPAEQQAIVNQCVFYAGKARQFAVQGDYNAAVQLFAVAGKNSTSPVLDAQSQLVCTMEIQAAEAYLDFVLGDYPAARKRIIASMSADEALEREYGHAILHIHRVHLANNLVKIEAASHNLAAGLTLAANILAYTQGRTECLPLPTQWGPRWTAAFSSEVRAFLLQQTTSEIACATAGLTDEETCSIWMTHLAQIDSGSHPDAPVEVAAWYSVKTAFIRCLLLGKAEASAFCHLAAEYLATGSRKGIQLHLLVGFDVLHLLAECFSADSFVLRTTIVQTLQQATHLPRQVRSRIALALPEMHTNASLAMPIQV